MHAHVKCGHDQRRTCTSRLVGGKQCVRRHLPRRHSAFASKPAPTENCIHPVHLIASNPAPSRLKPVPPGRRMRQRMHAHAERGHYQRRMQDPACWGKQCVRRHLPSRPFAFASKPAPTEDCIHPVHLIAPKSAPSRLEPVPLKQRARIQRHRRRTPVGPASAGKPLICFRSALDLLLIYF